GAFAARLLDLFPARAGSAPQRARAWTGVLLAACAAIAFAAVALRAPPWRVEAAFIDPANGRVLADGTPVRVGDALSLRIESTRATHVYVLNQDADGELNVLFPLAGLALDNPLPPDRVIHLPGSADGAALSWRITSPSASEEFVMIASPK